MHKIFSVEDDKDIQDLLMFSLTGFGYDVELFGAAEDLLDALESGKKPGLILLDIMLPGIDGIEALDKIKSDPRFSEIPVIMLTAKSAEMNIVGGLEKGADDYISKPFSVLELSARINARLRRTQKDETAIGGGIVMDPSSHEATHNGKPLELTKKEFALLFTLIKHPNKVINRDDLLKDIWGYDYLGETRTLDMHIRSLRQKLGSAAKDIVTVRGLGFKYCPSK